MPAGVSAAPRKAVTNVIVTATRRKAIDVFPSSVASMYAPRTPSPST